MIMIRKKCSAATGDATRWEIAITSESRREMMNKYILWQLNHVLLRVTQSSRLTSLKSKSKKGAIKKCWARGRPDGACLTRRALSLLPLYLARNADRRVDGSKGRSGLHIRHLGFGSFPSNSVFCWNKAVSSAVRLLKFYFRIRLVPTSKSNRYE